MYKMTVKDHMIDDIRSRLFNDRVNMPSCEVCGYRWSNFRVTMKSIEGTADVIVCEECFNGISMADDNNRDAIYEIMIKEIL